LRTNSRNSKQKKAPAAETKPISDQIIALKKEIGKAKKAAKPADEEDDEGAAKPKAAETKEAKPKTPAKAEAPKADAPKADAPKADAPKAEPAKETPKAEAAKPDAGKAKKPQEKKAEKGGAKDTPKAETPKEPKGVEAPKDAPKAESTPKERKKSEKETPKAERKKSEKEPEPKKEAAKTEDKTEAPVTVHAPTKKLRILGISGSLRKASFNTALLRFVQQSFPADVEFVIRDISGLPMYNQDTEYAPNQEVASFKEAVQSADAIFFCTPEYNFSFPGVLKNAIDVASRPWGSNSWANKPVGLMSASVAWSGGMRAQYALRQCFIFLNLIPYPGTEVMVTTADKVFDAAGNLTDPDTQKRVRDYVDGFVKFVHRYQAGTKAVP